MGKGRIEPGAGSGPVPSTIGSSWSKLPVGGNLENRPQNCPESGDAEPSGKTLPGNNELDQDRGQDESPVNDHCCNVLMIANACRGQWWVATEQDGVS